MMNELGLSKRNEKRGNLKKETAKPQNVKGKQENVKRARQKEVVITCAKVIIKGIKILTKNRGALTQTSPAPSPPPSRPCETGKPGSPRC